MMFETWKHVSKTEKRCCVFKDNESFAPASRYRISLHEVS